MMQRKVQIEGENQQKLFDKYMCSCKTNLQGLDADIATGKTTIEELQGSLKEQVATKGSLESDVVDATADLAEAKKTVEEATALRTKENAEFTTTDAQMTVDITALKKAVVVMDRSQSSSEFLQLGTSVTSTIQKLVATSTD